MTALTATGPTALAAAAAGTILAEAAPELVSSMREHLPRAMDVVSRRLVGAAAREGLTGGPDAVTWSEGRASLPVADGGGLVARATRHAFDRLEVAEPLATDPARLARRLVGSAEPIEAELTDATVNLALAYARRGQADQDLVAEAAETGARDLVELWAGLDADTRSVHFEQLATEGHNLHPCGRTRLGWCVPDLLAYDLETPVTAVGFVGVRRDLHLGDEIGPELLGSRPLDPDRYAITPVHPWQLRHVIRGRYAELVADRALVPLEVELPALGTGALRTLLLPGRPGLAGRFVKLSLDIQITSTRRSISVASTQNGPRLSRLLTTLLPECGERMLLMAETAGSAMIAPAGDRDLAAILRRGLSDQLAPGEVAIPGSALYARSPLTGIPVVAELVNRYRQTRGMVDGAAAAQSWLDEYARLLLPPVLRLATRHGIGLEVHLQNCLPTFVDGVPHRMAVRDLAGLRLHPPRLAQPLRDQVALWPGSVIVADDVDTMRSKVGYTAIQAHLAELIIQLGRSHDLSEPAAWRAIRSIVDDVFDGLAGEPGRTERARADHAFLTAPTVPHKALLRMRLAAGQGRGGDIYVPVKNPMR